MGKKRKAGHAENAQKKQTVSKNFQQIDNKPIAFLVAPTGQDEFMKSYWEQKPLLCRATEARKALFAGLLDFAGLKKLLLERQAAAEAREEPPLEFEVDINAMRYKDGKREDILGEDVADVEGVEEMYTQEGATFQFMQPQRFFDDLWRLVAALEGELGCLVGCNAYLTPPGTQGLAPHHDDVELWVCQTEGSKRWRLYHPLGGFQLPSQSSGNLEQGAIGEPFMDVVLEVGDVLYLPRGTIHQALTKEGTPSSHLTISTYQNWTYGELLGSCLQQMAASQQHPTAIPLPLRQGLPMGFLQSVGMQANLAAGIPGASANTAAQAAAKKLADAVRQLADHIEAHPLLLTTGSLPLAADFMRARIPPHPAQLPQPGPTPELDSKLVCRGPHNFMLTPCEAEPIKQVPEGFVKLCTCLVNDRTMHMMPPPLPGASEDDEGEEDDDDEDDEHPGEAGASGEDDEDEAPEAVPLEAEAAQNGCTEPAAAAPAAVDKEHGHGCGCCPAAPKPPPKPKHEFKAGANKHEHKAGAHKHEHSEACGHDHVHSEACGHAHHHHHHEQASGSDSESDSDGMDSDMEGHDGVPGVLLPSSAAMAVAQVLAAGPGGVAVRELLMEHDAEKQQVAFALWAEGFVRTLPADGEAKGHQKKKHKKK